MNDTLGTVETGLSILRKPQSVYLLHNRYKRLFDRLKLLCINCAIYINYQAIGTRETYIRYIPYTLYTDIMIGKDIWYTEPDNNREPWVIVTLETVKGRVVGWQVGHGNAVKITRLKRLRGNSDEKEVLEKLLDEIRDCRREDTITLVTYSPSTLLLLRSRILNHAIKDASFRGLRHLCVGNLLDQYFGGERRTTRAGRDSKILWEILTKIGPLIPRGVLDGEPL